VVFPFASLESKIYRIIVKDLGYCERENVDKRTVFTLNGVIMNTVRLEGKWRKKDLQRKL
jgi:hypothetical protein